MESILETIQYTIPSLVVFLAVYFLLKEFFRNERVKRNQELTVERVKISLPLRLQAYERIILLLERISPQNLVMRLHSNEMDGAGLHRLIVQTVREEYNHNLSQQLYVSVQAWEMVKKAKEEVIRLINTTVAQAEEAATSTDLGNRLLEISADNLIIRKALDFLKAEAAKVY